MDTKKIKEIDKNRELVAKCKTLFKSDEDYRNKFDWEWLVRHLYVRGYQFSRYNRDTNSIVFGTPTGVRIPINLVGAHIRGVRNQVTSFQPKWEVLPNVTTDTAYDNARYSGKVLDYIYKVARIKRKIKEAVNYALITSVGIWQFDVGLNGTIVINCVDPYDFYVDPNVKSPDLNDPTYGAEHVFVSHQVPIDYIEKHPKYKIIGDLSPDNLVASASYKRFLLEATKNRVDSANNSTPTALLKQGWIRERDENGELKMKVVTFLDSLEDPLLIEDADDTDYPFEVLQGDITSNELYGESWVKHLIPINRVINALESHIFEYNHFFAKGRYVIDKNSGIRVIVNQHGQIIEKNRGANVTSLPISPLPTSPQEQIVNMRRYLEDISGVHDVSLGRLPGTIRSGVAIAELKQADSTNQNDLIDNLEDFLARSGHKILKLVAENWTSAKLISVTGMGGKPERFMAIGESGRISKEMKKKRKYSFGDEQLPIAIIGKENEVRVQVGSWLAYTKEARSERLKELFRLGAIDQKTYLEYSEFSDIDGIIQRTRDEQVIQQRAGSPSASIEKQYGIEMDDQSLAMAENELMQEGVDQPVMPEDDHEVHLAVHKEELDNDLVKAHYNQHLQQMKWQAKMGSQPLPPEMGEGGAMAGAKGEPIPPGQPIGGMPESGGVPGGMGMPPGALGQMLGTSPMGEK